MTVHLSRPSHLWQTYSAAVTLSSWPNTTSTDTTSIVIYQQPDSLDWRSLSSKMPTGSFFGKGFLFYTLLLRPIYATIPYTPSHILSIQRNGTLAYLLQPKPNHTGVQLLSVNLSQIDSTSSPDTVLFDNVPFAADDEGATFVPFMDLEGAINVVSGNCHAPANAERVWTFHPDKGSAIGNGTWSSASVDISSATQDASPLGPAYLARGFSFATSNNTVPSLYTFGGMCPFANSSSEDWMSGANYSRAMASLDPSQYSPSGNYNIGLTASPNPPVAEAGFTITPLQGTTSTTPAGNRLQQGDFLFVGGHTQTAFINMSSLALFSLPQGSWTYIPVNTTPATRTDLAARDAQVEPRSGHTAVTSSDGGKIIIFGGWVGDTSTPADPQLVILEIGEDYGGSGQWSWSIPTLPAGSGLPQGSGIFGHAAVMLPGDVMAVFGGYNISSQSAISKRGSSGLQLSSQVHLYNVTSNSWTTSYTNPGSQQTGADRSASGPMSSTGEKAGLGVGLSAAAVALFGVAYCFWWRKRSNHRRSREQELRKLALGAERSHIWSEPGMAASFHGPMKDIQPSDLRRSIMNSRYLPSPNHQYRAVSNQQHAAAAADAERTGLLIEVPSPTRGLRRNVATRSGRFQSAGWNNDPRLNYGAGFIHPIDESEEYETPPESLEPANSEHGSSKNPALADPFVDPPPSRSPPGSFNDDASRARHHESENVDSASVHSRGSRSVSPDKSERTHSNLSESSVSGLSVSSIQRSNVGSVRTGPHLFHSGIPNLDRSARSESSSPSGRESPPKNVSRSDPHHVKFLSSSVDTRTILERSVTADSFSTAPTSLRQSQWEGESLMEAGSEWATPPDSPTKLSTRKTTTTTIESKRNYSTWLGSIRKTLSGAKKAASLSGPGFQDPASAEHNPPRPSSSSPEHRESPGRRLSASSAVHMRRKQGPRDWGAVADKRRSGHSFMSLSPSDAMTAEDVFDDHDDDDDDDDNDWDVEAAAENRVVQVTYTVPKEKLRVVNAGVGDLVVGDDDDDKSERAERASIGGG